MTTYSHHISGRLRTRYPQLKNNPARARVVEAAIRKIDGVLSVEASTVTGSLLVRYDPCVDRREALLDMLYRAKQQLGLIQAQRAPVPAPKSVAKASLANTLAEKAFDMMVEKCIERSTYALFAALL